MIAILHGPITLAFVGTRNPGTCKSTGALLRVAQPAGLSSESDMPRHAKLMAIDYQCTEN